MKTDFINYLNENSEMVLYTGVVPMMKVSLIVLLLNYMENNIFKKAIRIYKIQNDKITNELISDYKDLLKRYKKLLNELKINDSLSIYFINNYLIHNGYFSVNHKMNYKSSNDFLDYRNTLASEIVAGRGVCRHLSIFLRDIYKEMGFESYAVVVKLNDVKTKFINVTREQFNKNEIIKYIDNKCIDERKIRYLKNKIEESLQNNKYTKVLIEYNYKKDPFICNICGNHVMTLVKENDKAYFLDSLNKDIYNKNADFFTSEDDAMVYINYIITSVFEQKKAVSNIKRIIPLIDNIDTYEKMDKIATISKNIDEMIINNKNLLDDFYSNNLQLYSNMCDRLLKLKK